LAATGAVLLLAGFIGGGFEIKDIKAPKLSSVTRILCSAAGAALIGLVVVLLPGEATQGPVVTPPPESVPEMASVEVPLLQGLSEEGARDELLAMGLVSGAVSIRQVWAADGTVVEQTPANGELVSTGSPVNLVLADSTTTYRTEKIINTNDGEEISARIDYQINLIQAENQDQLIGQFIMLASEITGAGAEMGQTIDLLRQASGYVSMDAVDEMDLESTWSAFSDIARDLQHDVAIEQIGDSASFATLGPAIQLALASGEILFDIKTLLTTVPSGSVRAISGFDLQAADDWHSAIRIEGPATVSDAGRTRRFNVTRRTSDDERFQSIGSATYSAQEGLLTGMEIVLTLAGETGVYRLKIDRSQ